MLLKYWLNCVNSETLKYQPYLLHPSGCFLVDNQSFPWVKICTTARKEYTYDRLPKNYLKMEINTWTEYWSLKIQKVYGSYLDCCHSFLGHFSWNVLYVCLNNIIALCDFSIASSLCFREKKMSRTSALKVLDHGMIGPEGADNCHKFVDILGLRTIFPLFMKTPKKMKKTGASEKEHEGQSLISTRQ